MPMTDRDAYVELAAMEGIAMTDGSYTKEFGGVARLSIRRLNKLMFEYRWGERIVEKHVALSVVRTFGERTR